MLLSLLSKNTYFLLTVLSRISHCVFKHLHLDFLPSWKWEEHCVISQAPNRNGDRSEAGQFGVGSLSAMQTPGSSGDSPVILADQLWRPFQLLFWSYLHAEKVVCYLGGATEVDPSVALLATFFYLFALLTTLNKFYLPCWQRFFQLFALVATFLPCWQRSSNYLPCWQRSSIICLVGNVLPIICLGGNTFLHWSIPIWCLSAQTWFLVVLLCYIFRFSTRIGVLNVVLFFVCLGSSSWQLLGKSPCSRALISNGFNLWLWTRGLRAIHATW